MRGTGAALLQQRAVFVTGARTPFVKSFGKFKTLDTVALADAAVKGLLDKTKLDPKEIDHIVWGNVVLQATAPNCAREVVMDLNLPRRITANATGMACASGLQAMTAALMMIEGGHADVVIAGGSDSMSNAELPLPRRVMYGLHQYPRHGVRGFVAEAGYNPFRWIPPNKARADRTTGKTMGYYGDRIGEIHHITREAQEAYALESHRKAAAAEQKQYFAGEITPVTVTDGKSGEAVIVTRDDVLQRNVDAMRAKMPHLKPAFRSAPEGTVTAATSSALTDGGSAMLFMSEKKALQLGFPTDISVKSWHLCALDPYPELLMAPVLGWGPCLKKAGLTPDEIDLFEVHEAFAAQVLATLQALQSPDFYEKFIGDRSAVVLSKPIDDKKLNVNGSSLALGHPFAATGGRIITSLANELRRSGKRHGLISICAAGGLGGVAILEHTPAVVATGSSTRTH